MHFFNNRKKINKTTEMLFTELPVIHVGSCPDSLVRSPTKNIWPRNVH